MTNQTLQNEVLTRLYHAHPNGLGKEVLDNFEGEKAVAETLKQLQDKGLIQDGAVTVRADDEPSVRYPIKLSAAGVTAAKAAGG
ncbi:hypothetical protein [Pseudomonas sp. BRM28]|uniref:hypothetical protein n=1 Tax=Pseudomonas sp. BRM28 TaxID=2045201 RepID=UPI000CEE981E|nr:hypothetical protein [Pseudomonas sp. BRM28]PPS61839.1 hypothetical protein CR917_13025 [Pseudomonas sp. BRM28]